MRAEFNTTCDIHNGPGSATPGLFVGTFACRYVDETAILPSLPGSPDITAYLTIEDYEPVGIWTFPFFGADPALSDRVVIASRPTENYWVVYVDIINWLTQAPYYRAYLALEPAPATAPIGGILFGGTASIGWVRVPLIDGGILFGGAATWSSSTVVDGDGGILFGGAATWSFTPGVVYYWLDTFTDTNGTNITSHIGELTPGGYTTIAGTTATIQGNKLVCTNITGGNSTWTRFDHGRASFTLDTIFQLAPISAVAGGQTVRVYYRFNGSMMLNCWVEVFNPSGSDVITDFKVYTGFGTLIGTGTTTMATNTPYTCKIVTTSTTVDVTINGVTINLTDSSLNTLTKSGLAVNTGSVSNLQYFDIVSIT